MHSQEIQNLQGQLDQQREQLATGEATRMEIEAVREYRRSRQQEQQLGVQLKQLQSQQGQVRACVLARRDVCLMHVHNELQRH